MGGRQCVTGALVLKRKLGAQGIYAVDGLVQVEKEKDDAIRQLV